ncbi:MAG: diguanylate cyclase [Nitrospirae bacterium]|nr:MAG: diguanylate cyclase [Nitrospirota bacterium]
MEAKKLKKGHEGMLDGLAIPVLIIDNYGKITGFNEALLGILGVDSEKLKDRHIKDFEQLSPLWPSVLYAKSSSETVKDRIKLKDREYEILLKSNQWKFKNDIITITFYDISHFLNLEEQLLKRNKELMIINTLSTTFINSENISEVFKDLLEKVLMLTEFKIGMIMLRENTEFRIVAESGISKEFSKGARSGELDKLLWYVFDEGQPLYIAEEDELKTNPFFTREGIEFLVISPLVISDNIFGALLLASRKPISFDFDLASIVSLVANHSSLIIEKVKLFEEAQRLSITDALTGLYNVRYFYKSLQLEIERAKRYNDEFSLVIYDIDDFKAVNDTYGHQAGDDLLKEFADILCNFSRRSDIVARYGGEEFVMILPKTTKQSAHNLANRILERVRSHTFLQLKGYPLNITVSGGISCFPEDADNEKDLLYFADMALYKAKQDGKDRVVFYDKNIHAEVL